VKETDCRQREDTHWINCVGGDFGALAGLASLCVGAAIAVALVPGCDRSWVDWNTWSRKRAGTYGRGFPADMSLWMVTVVPGICCFSSSRAVSDARSVRNSSSS
jgi:hypothetical protein